MTVAEVTELHVYPVSGEPGRDLEEAAVDSEGLAGDRRKKAAVHVVAAADVAPDTRANLVVSTARSRGFVEDAWSGRSLRVGEVVLRVGLPSPRCAVRSPTRHVTGTPGWAWPARSSASRWAVRRPTCWPGDRCRSSRGRPT